MKKTDYCAVELKELREIIAKWYTARCLEADAKAILSDKVASFKAVIATDLEQLELPMSKRNSMKMSDDELRAEIAEQRKRVKTAENDAQSMLDEYARRQKLVLDVFSTAMYVAYKEYCEDASEKNKSAYSALLKSTFADKLGDRELDMLMRATGCVSTQSKKLIKSGKLCVAMSEAKWRRVILDRLADDMKTAGALAEHKFTYVAPSKRKK